MCMYFFKKNKVVIKIYIFLCIYKYLLGIACNLKFYLFFFYILKGKKKKIIKCHKEDEEVELSMQIHVKNILMYLYL